MIVRFVLALAAAPAGFFAGSLGWLSVVGAIMGVLDALGIEVAVTTLLTFAPGAGVFVAVLAFLGVMSL